MYSVVESAGDLMADTGWLSVQAGSDALGVGHVAWGTPENIYDTEDSHATAAYVGPASDQSHYLLAQNPGATIPAGSIIDGIEVQIEQKASADEATQYATDYIVKLIKGDGTYSSTDHSRGLGTHWGLIDGYITYGGSADLWGETWTVATLNGTVFGAALSANLQSSLLGITASVDHVQIKIYYHAPIGYTQAYIY